MPCLVDSRSRGDHCAYVVGGGGSSDSSSASSSSTDDVDFHQQGTGGKNPSTGKNRSRRAMRRLLSGDLLLPCDSIDIKRFASATARPAEGDVPGVEESLELSVATFDQNGFSSSEDDLSSEDSIELDGSPLISNLPASGRPLSPSGEIDGATVPSQCEDSSKASFASLRLTYLMVTLVIMLADGLQGTLKLTNIE